MGTIKSLEQRLRELKSQSKAGKISREDYEKKRDEILMKLQQSIRVPK